ncbi:hypothetical protein T492DRAFT_880650, partial [Pavlovales sp. CCMP2436]
MGMIWCKRDGCRAGKCPDGCAVAPRADAHCASCSTTAEKYKKDTGVYKPEDAAPMACRVRRLEEHAKARPRDRGPEYEAYNEKRRAVDEKLVAFLVEDARQGDETHAVLAAAAAGNGYPPPRRRRLGPVASFASVTPGLTAGAVLLDRRPFYFCALSLDVFQCGDKNHELWPCAAPGLWFSSCFMSSVEEPEAARKDWRIGLRALPGFLVQALRFWPLQNQAAQLEALFLRSPRLRALLSFDSLCVGLSPYAAPPAFSLLAAIETDSEPGCGVFYPRGGFAQVAHGFAEGVEAMEGLLLARLSALAPIAAQRGNTTNSNQQIISLNALARAHYQRSIGTRGVERILTAALRPNSLGRALARCATGKRLSTGEELEADVMVCSADLAAAEPALLELKLVRSAYDPPQAAAAAERDPFRPPWDSVLPAGGGQGTFPPEGAASGRPAAAYDNLMVLVPVPPLDEGWSEPEARAAVDRWVGAARNAAIGALERAGCEHVREDVTSEARYGLRRGAVFGLSHGLAQLSVFWPEQATGRVQGLFFVGASTNDSKDNLRIRLSNTNKPSVFQGMMRELQVLTDKDATLAQGFVGNEFDKDGIVAISAINGQPGGRPIELPGAWGTGEVTTSLISVPRLVEAGAIVHYEKGASYIDLSAIGG